MQTYLASGLHANSRAKIGDWVSANKELDTANVANPIDKPLGGDPPEPADGLPLRRLGRDARVRRRRHLLAGMVDWVNGKDTKGVLDGIESSWPK